MPRADQILQNPDIPFLLLLHLPKSVCLPALLKIPTATDQAAFYIDLLTAEELKLMEKMRPGLIQLEIGVQSTNSETLKAMLNPL